MYDCACFNSFHKNAFFNVRQRLSMSTAYFRKLFRETVEKSIFRIHFPTVQFVSTCSSYMIYSTYYNPHHYKLLYTTHFTKSFHQKKTLFHPIMEQNKPEEPGSSTTSPSPDVNTSDGNASYQWVLDDEEYLDPDCDDFAGEMDNDYFMRLLDAQRINRDVGFPTVQRYMKEIDTVLRTATIALKMIGRNYGNTNLDSVSATNTLASALNTSKQTIFQHTCNYAKWSYAHGNGKYQTNFNFFMDKTTTCAHYALRMLRMIAQDASGMSLAKFLVIELRPNQQNRICSKHFVEVCFFAKTRTMSIDEFTDNIIMQFHELSCSKERPQTKLVREVVHKIVHGD